MGDKSLGLIVGGNHFYKTLMISKTEGEKDYDEEWQIVVTPYLMTTSMDPIIAVIDADECEQPGPGTIPGEFVQAPVVVNPNIGHHLCSAAKQAYGEKTRNHWRYSEPETCSGLEWRLHFWCREAVSDGYDVCQEI